MADTGILEGAGASGEVKPIQGFAVSKCAETCLEKSPSEHFSWQNSSSSTPTVPYSSADVLYGNEISRSNHFDELRQNSFVDLEKDLQQKNRELEQIPGNRRPSSKNGSRKSSSLDKVPTDRERDDGSSVGTSLPPTKPGTRHFRPNGLRNNILKGDQIYTGNVKGNGSTGSIGRDDDLVAMGTLFSPNQHQQKTSSMQNGISSANSSANTSSNSLTNNAPKNLSVNTTPPSSLTALTPPTRKFGYGPVGTNGRPLLTQSSSGSGIRNLWRDRDGKETEPRYVDPLGSGAPASFQQRVMELGALESETVRWERNKKMKKKNKQDRDS